ncbi:MAG: macro domain-containing protein [Acidimicrobiia bacterium]|nr:macro domain-containing protein [Acidimicrobiia bacterium]
MEIIAIKRVGGTNILAVEGDVTRQPVEGVVNSANESLQHKEGVATAVVRTGGRVIQEESDTWVREHGPVEPGAAAVTTGGMLQASHVIHTVAPYYAPDTSDGVLWAAVAATLDAAVEHELESLAFPLLGAGLRGYPAERSASVMVEAVVTWLTANPDLLTEIRLVGFSQHDAELFAAALSE